LTKTIPFRKRYEKLSNRIFTTIRPETGTNYYSDGETYDIYHRRNFLFKATIIKHIRNIKLKDIPENVIRNDIDPPYNTKEEFFNLMEKMYKNNYYRPEFWNGWDTVFRIIWMHRVDELRKWI